MSGVEAGLLHGKNMEKGEEGCRASCQKAVYAFLVVIICVGAVYIPYLQSQHANELASLTSRMDKWEEKVQSCSCMRAGDAGKQEAGEVFMHEGMVLKEQPRAKRQAFSIADANEDDLNETNHIKNEHHGIASSHIALIYADPENLKQNIARGGRGSSLTFTNSTRSDPHCKRMRQNEKQDLWCSPFHQFKQKDRLLLQGSEGGGFFSYFTKAEWMNGENSRLNFEMRQDEQKKLIVKQPGIYIVTTSLHFSNVSRGTVHYGVYARNRAGDPDSERVLGICVSTILPNRVTNNRYPCSTWQLAPLRAGDEVFMRINPFEWLIVEKESFFLALIKLNDYNMLPADPDSTVSPQLS